MNTKDEGSTVKKEGREITENIPGGSAFTHNEITTWEKAPETTIKTAVPMLLLFSVAWDRSIKSMYYPLGLKAHN